MFAQIYTGCKCPNSQTWQVETVVTHNLDNDKEYPYLVCQKCHSSVEKELIDDEGNMIVHKLTDEDIFWESFMEGDGEF